MMLQLSDSKIWLSPLISHVSQSLESHTLFHSWAVSRHTTVCHAAKKPAHNTMSILTGRKKTRFLYFCISVVPLQNKMIFAVDTPANVSSPHTKFEQNHFKRSQDI